MHNTVDYVLNTKTTSRYTKPKLFRPTKISRLIIEVTTTQEEVIVVGGDSMVRGDTIKIDSKIIYPEGLDARAIIKMAT